MSFPLPLLAATLETQFPGIEFAYLFGSAKDGVVAPGSDIDICL